jgi:selenocysteine lyase/cysteine desulfurase
VDIARLRDEFAVLRRQAYLNAGSDGPVPSAALIAARAELERQASDGRFTAHFERRGQLATALRAAYAGLLGCEAADVALTTSTSEGISIAVAGLQLGPGDEIVTSDEEHPGLLGPLQAAHEIGGASVRMVPLEAVADAVGPATRLVACSHVSWVTGSFAPVALAELNVPVLLDGAQGVGAVPVDVGALGCDLYAGAGQKWLCGADGTGMLYVSPGIRERLASITRSYGSFADPGPGLDSILHADARRYDTPSLSAEALAFAEAALVTLAEAGWPAVHERGRTLAAQLAEALEERGYSVAPRGDTTLVAFSSVDAADRRDGLAERGVMVRDLPGRELLRASVGAWNDEHDVERLLTGLEATAGSGS